LKKLIILFCLISTFAVRAQQTTNARKWNFFLEPYLMFPNMAGVTGLRNLPDVEVKASASDVLSHLQIGALAYFEAYTDRWALYTDLFYGNMEQDATPGSIISGGTASARQTLWETGSLYRLNSFLEAGAGFRLNNVASGLDIERYKLGGGTESLNASLTKTWVDPILIARVSNASQNKWRFLFRSDLGGFGIGSDLAWQVQGYAGYRFSKVFQLMAGYRFLSLNYSSGTGQDYFKYDMNIFGPVILFGFHL
jgi:hypothetical protein